MTDAYPDLIHASRQGRILVVRHAIVTGERVEDTPSLHAAARQIRTHTGPRAIHILTSPVHRAVVTGQALAKQLGTTSRSVGWLRVEDVPADCRQEMQAALSDIGADGALVLVTHMPQVEQLTRIRNPANCSVHRLAP